MSVSTGPGPRSRITLVGMVAALAALIAVAGWWLARSEDGPAADPEPRASGGPAAAASSTLGSAPASADAQGEQTTEATPSATAEPSGSLEPVPYAEVTPRPAVPLSATADFGTGLTVEITRVEAVRSKAERPGEISAPAVRLTMRAHNDSKQPITVEGMVVTLEYGADRTPAVNVHEPGGDPFAGVVAPGATARGVYVFNVPARARDRIRVVTSYTGAAPTLVLAGSVA